MVMNSSGDGMMSMPMYFSNSMPVIVVFKGWTISDASTLAGSCVGVAIMGIIYELIKRFRYLLTESYFKDNKRNHQSQISVAPDEYSSRSTDSHRKSRHSWFMHLLNSVILLIQVFTSYMLMLIVMTYNYWLFISVVVGLAFGYFLTHFVVVYVESKWKKTLSSPESCKLSVMETVNNVIRNETVRAERDDTSKNIVSMD